MKKYVHKCYQWNEKEKDFDESERAYEFEDSQVRDEEICTFCGFSTYPECKEWCRNAKIDRGEITKKK